jgi:hypothetical protein
MPSTDFFTRAAGRACFAWTTHHPTTTDISLLYARFGRMHRASKLDECNTGARRSKTKRMQTPFGQRRVNAATTIDVGHHQSSKIVYLYAHPQLPQICSMTMLFNHFSPTVIGSDLWW